MEILLAKNQDIDGWMNLVCKVKENFPGIETEDALNEHRSTVSDFIHNESAICAKIEDKIVGALLFSKDNNIGVISVVAYFVIKSAVKAALREFEQEKSQQKDNIE